MLPTMRVVCLVVRHVYVMFAVSIEMYMYVRYMDIMVYSFILSLVF